MAAGILTLAQIRTAAQQRADMVNSTFVTSAEWTSYINQALSFMYDEMVSAYGEDYFSASPVSITMDGTSQSYALPNGTLYSSAPAFYKLLGVDLAVNTSTSSWVTLKPFTFSARNKRNQQNMNLVKGYTNIRYRVNGNNLLFDVIPAGGQTIRIWYVPRMTELSGESDTADGINGWLELAILHAAITAMIKEESDVTALMLQKQEMLQRLRSMAPNRDVGMPATVSDTQNLEYDDPTYGGGSF